MPTKSYSVNASFNFRAVITDRTQADILKAIQTEPQQRVHQHAAVVAAYEEGGMDGAVAFMLKMMMKDLQKLIISESDGETIKNVSPIKVEVTPRGN